MRTINRFAVSSAVGLFTACGAQAADLPVKAKAVEYVKICSTYGAGFYYVPGTDTCVKIGGYSRQDATLNGNGPFESPSWVGNSGQANRLRNYYVLRARENINIDTRTATEYGLLRTYYEGTFQYTSGTDASSGVSLDMPRAFIQFAGFMFGRTVSQFDSPWSGYPGNFGSFVLGGYDDQTGINLAAYTADFGSGVTASLSLEDQASYRASQFGNMSAETPTLYATGVLGANSFGGARVPDVIGQLRVDQEWGLFQASVAAHDIHSAYYGPSEPSGHPADAWGWAGQLALSIKHIPTGPGDTINLSVGIANGASRYIIGGVNGNSFAMYGGASVPGAYQSIAFGASGDGVFAGTSAATGTSTSKSDLWGLRGAYTHNWNPFWNTSIFGAYTSVNWGSRGRGLICNAAVMASIVGTCNPNFNLAQLGATTRWTPVTGLTFSAELMWNRLDQNNSGTIALPVIGTKPAAVYAFKDQSTVVGGLRVQRNF